MSSHLRWQPVKFGQSLGTGIKFILRKIYGNPIDVILTSADVNTLRAIVASNDSAASDADELVSAIEAHGNIELKEYF